MKCVESDLDRSPVSYSGQAISCFLTYNTDSHASFLEWLGGVNKGMCVLWLALGSWDVLNSW